MITVTAFELSAYSLNSTVQPASISPPPIKRSHLSVTDLTIHFADPQPYLLPPITSVSTVPFLAHLSSAAIVALGRTPS